MPEIRARGARGSRWPLSDHDRRLKGIALGHLVSIPQNGRTVPSSGTQICGKRSSPNLSATRAIKNLWSRAIGAVATLMLTRITCPHCGLVGATAASLPRVLILLTTRARRADQERHAGEVADCRARRAGRRARRLGAPRSARRRPRRPLRRDRAPRQGLKRYPDRAVPAARQFGAETPKLLVTSVRHLLPLPSRWPSALHLSSAPPV